MYCNTPARSSFCVVQNNAYIYVSQRSFSHITNFKSNHCKKQVWKYLILLKLVASGKEKKPTKTNKKHKTRDITPSCDKFAACSMFLLTLFSTAWETPSPVAIWIAALIAYGAGCLQLLLQKQSPHWGVGHTDGALGRQCFIHIFMVTFIIQVWRDCKPRSKHWLPIKLSKK